MTISLSVDDGVAVIRIDSPPVNGLSLAVRRGLLWAFERIAERADVRAAVLVGGGRGFSAGGEIAEFGTPAASASPGLSLDVHPAIETCGKPVVAALHGFAIGGGLETALACHYRVAEASTKIALPEGRLGVIPLSGTQRVPRLIGFDATLDLILGGETRRAEDFAGTSLFDRITPAGGGLAAALVVAREVMDLPAHPLVRDLPAPQADGLAPRRAGMTARGAPPIELAIFDAVAASVEAADFDAGMAQARAIYDRLAASKEALAARDAFFAPVGEG
jgi:enoyl-CoA hydratase